MKQLQKFVPGWQRIIIKLLLPFKEGTNVRYYLLGIHYMLSTMQGTRPSVSHLILTASPCIAAIGLIFQWGPRGLKYFSQVRSATELPKLVLTYDPRSFNSFSVRANVGFSQNA